MFARGWMVLLAGVVGLGMFCGGTSSAKADDVNRRYHYPYYYFPHNYWPNYQPWPVPGRHFQPAPAWQAYPPYLDINFTYPLFESAGPWHEQPEQFRRHALAARHAADRIAELGRLPAADELALAALLHDVGRLVLVRLYPGYAELLASGKTPEERLQAERKELGVDHALVGGVLVRRWRLAPGIGAAIERHHAEDADGPAAAIALADLIAHHSQGDAISPERLTELGSRCGLSADRVRALAYEFPYIRGQRRRSSEPCPLSGRELDALRGLAEGKVYKEIAEELSLSASTVRTHLHNVYRKIGAVDRAQAVLIARDRGWI